MKTCTSCNKEKSIENFAINTDRHGNKRPYSKCKECVRDTNRRRYRNNSEQIKARVAEYQRLNPEKKNYSDWKYRLKKHGIDEYIYWEIFYRQEGKCAICKKEKDGFRLCVDHDHNCCDSKYGCKKCVRGLLCHKCNIGLGSFEDNLDSLKSAVEYLAS